MSDVQARKPPQRTAGGGKRGVRTTRPAAGGKAGRLPAAAAASPLHLQMHERRYEWTGARRLTAKSRCGALLERIRGVLAAKPPYLHPADLARYEGLIPRFQAFKVREFRQEGERAVPVAQLPVSRLGFALQQWIGAALQHHRETLTPTFVLDAARFIEAHAWGRDFYEGGAGDTWEIGPLLPDTVYEQWPFYLGQDKQLKTHVTSGLKDLIVRFVVPAGSAVTDTRRGEAAPGPMEGFGSVQRCHLSAGFFDWVEAQGRDDPPMRHDVAWELKLLVSLRTREAVEAIERGEFAVPEPGPQLELPGRWIAAALVWPPGERREVLPVWESSVTACRHA